jgi:small subunit ribosomal protein S12e
MALRRSRTPQEETIAISGVQDKLSVEDALKSSLQHDGLPEYATASDKRQAHLRILVETNTEAEYRKLIETLYADHKISLIKVGSGPVATCK